MHVGRKLFPQVFQSCDEPSTLFDNVFGLPRILVRPIARNSIEIVVLFKGKARGNARAAKFSALQLPARRRICRS